ncbi:MAG: RNA polymerase sigma factor [Planctomycetes bacterium]|nr:RNA polymerase sigma factor [Planctomycetota bacterium]
MSKLAVGTPVRSPAVNGASGLPGSGAETSEERFVRAFNDSRAELVSTLFFVLGNMEDAHDAAQDAFLKCWRARKSLKDVRNLRAWIFRVGLNAAKDLQRSAWRKRARPLCPDLQPGAERDASPAENLEEKEVLEQLRRALLQLRPEEKAIFLLRQNGDLTYEEIAELRCRPVGTVKTQMRTALQKLREILKGTTS